MDPATGLLYCDQCSHPVDEYDPNAQAGQTASDERLTTFNNATQPIRDALKSIENVMVPSLNIVAWIAQNVKQAPLPGQSVSVEEEKGKYKVVIGDEGDERERIEKARLAEAQRWVITYWVFIRRWIELCGGIDNRTQNALPIWHTHSTVTGSATSLGLDTPSNKDQTISTDRKNSLQGQADTSQGLADYYANLVEEDDEEESDVVEHVDIVKKEPIDQCSASFMGDEEEDEMEEMDPSVEPTPDPNGAVMVMGESDLLCVICSS